jgi:hypothetical protein
MVQLKSENCNYQLSTTSFEQVHSVVYHAHLMAMAEDANSYSQLDQLSMLLLWSKPRVQSYYTMQAYST